MESNICQISLVNIWHYKKIEQDFLDIVYIQEVLDNFFYSELPNKMGQDFLDKKLTLKDPTVYKYSPGEVQICIFFYCVCSRSSFCFTVFPRYLDTIL